MELAILRTIYTMKNRARDEKEGLRTAANGVDKAQARSAYLWVS